MTVTIAATAAIISPSVASLLFQVTGSDIQPAAQALESAAGLFELNLGDSERIHLYGTPGQERFNFMWDILTHGGIGLILLLNNTRPDPFRDMHFFLDSFKGFIGTTKVVIGVTQMDLASTPTLEDYHLQLESAGSKTPIFEVDARIKRDVSLLVEALLYSLDPGLDS